MQSVRAPRSSPLWEPRAHSLTRQDSEPTRETGHGPSRLATAGRGRTTVFRRKARKAERVRRNGPCSSVEHEHSDAQPNRSAVVPPLGCQCTTFGARARRAWVSRARAELAHDAARAPWLFVGLLAAIPVGWLWGSVAAALVAVALGLFAYMAVYVVWVHRREYHGEFESVSSQLAELDRPREVREKAHWRTPSKPAHL